MRIKSMAQHSLHGGTGAWYRLEIQAPQQRRNTIRIILRQLNTSRESLRARHAPKVSCEPTTFDPPLFRLDGLWKRAESELFPES